ncbi:glycoside hydrolase family 97 protein [Dysgonomonas sp. Marseille-P4677]|uniref:glycoside hydrolase family 97 protein n=1 Tax=Dysgonomonas sp. Marseille-P4677 TaxID=2364790 RepID=UPI0019145028|nr:glycoside hydrolase family 97 protein [Dysgonomonas sp. Marseille-P4677]MBK5722278.1 glycoside hydrolase family 97 protein [Dysgonomonas sp. Marseille-P4677]
MRRSVLLLICVCLFTVGTKAKEILLTSPDGKLKVTISDDEGRPSYKIDLGNEVFLDKSPLGLKTNIGDFSSGMRLDENMLFKVIDEKYELSTIKHRENHYVANEGIFTFRKDNKLIYDIIFRISNNDIAFQYKLYPQGDTLCCIVNEEKTGFVLPQGATTFLCPQSGPMGGFARTSPSYETPYTVDGQMGKNGWGEGFTFPCLFRNKDKGWILISETGVSSLYCGSRLIGHDKGLYTIGFPQKGEYNGNGTVEPGLSLPGRTPWRTITIGETLKPIVETTIPFDVVEPLYEAKQEFKYSRGTWSWIIGGDESISYDEQIRYIDFSAAMGYETILIDAYWDTLIGRDKIAQLAEYGKRKNVALYLWYNSNGYWNDAPQTPKNIMSNTIARRKEMQWMKDIGIRGIKVDFFGSDKQVTMQLYEDILTDANDFGLMVIFHGCTLPRGWERMYPNFVSSEAVLASEMLHFSQNACDSEAFNATLHPFIRNTVGSMDFGGSTLNKFYNPINSSEMWGGHRRTSDVFALAVAVLFQSPVQHFALTPTNLTDAPTWAIDFMKKVPVTWDETRFIDGYPGKYIILARRSGQTWFVTGVNAEKETLNVKIKLPMFKAGETLVHYKDNSKLEGNVLTSILDKNQMIELEIPCNGGVVLVK